MMQKPDADAISDAHYLIAVISKVKVVKQRCD
jgi:hypothetical protein